jgi:hypothetical protein
MAQFDRAFIPVLCHTYHGDMNSAKEAVIYLNFQWQKFENQYMGALPDDDDWQEGFRLIEDWLGDAYQSIDHNDHQLAEIQLEHVRYELRQLRRHADLDYFLDDLYDFQNALDVVWETASDQQLCLLEWPEFEVLAQEATQKWNTLQAQQLDYRLFEFDPYQQARFKAAKTDIQNGMNDFQKAVDCANIEQIARTARQIEPKIWNLLALFGNFEAAQTYYAQQ